jgi:hypothetical protein
MISHRCLGIAGVALMTLLSLPRESAAGLGDIIVGMSGPQMVGVVAHCRVPVGRSVTECHVLNREGTDRNYWVSFEGGLYGSTWKNGDDNEYGLFDVGMLTFEPLFEFRLWPGGEVRSGVGPGYNFLFGKKFQGFDKLNIKFRLIAVESPNLDLAVNLRVYPEGFTSDEFGFDTRVDIDRPVEYVIGFSVGFRKVWRW